MPIAIVLVRIWMITNLHQSQPISPWSPHFSASPLHDWLSSFQGAVLEDIYWHRFLLRCTRQYQSSFLLDNACAPYHANCFPHEPSRMAFVENCHDFFACSIILCVQMRMHLSRRKWFAVDLRWLDAEVPYSNCPTIWTWFGGVCTRIIRRLILGFYTKQCQWSELPLCLINIYLPLPTKILHISTKLSYSSYRHVTDYTAEAARCDKSLNLIIPTNLLPELQLQYSNYKNGLQQIAQKIGDVEQEAEEHKFVPSSLSAVLYVKATWVPTSIGILSTNLTARRNAHRLSLQACPRNPRTPPSWEEVLPYDQWCPGWKNSQRCGSCTENKFRRAQEGLGWFGQAI